MGAGASGPNGPAFSICSIKFKVMAFIDITELISDSSNKIFEIKNHNITSVWLSRFPALNTNPKNLYQNQILERVSYNLQLQFLLCELCWYQKK